VSSTDSTRATESQLVPRCASRWALLWLCLGFFWGCLNPVPDEFPSGRPVEIDRESCDDNPYLVGCEAPAPNAPPDLDPGAPGVTPPLDNQEPTDTPPAGNDADAGPDAGPPLDADVER
jgi:hypothetical protein